MSEKTLQKIVISLNGRLVKPSAARLSVFDRGALLGYGAFDTALAVGETTLWLAEHVRRFDQTLRKLNIPRRFNQNEIKELINRAVAAHPADLKQVRITHSAGSGEMWGDKTSPHGRGSLWIIVKTRRWELDKKITGEIVRTELAAPWLIKLKSTSRLPFLPPFQPRTSRTRKHSAQILVCQSEGVMEFTNANLLILSGEDIFMPRTQSVFEGLTLKKTRTALARSGRKIKERRLTLADLLRADEVIGLNSLSLAFALAEMRYITRSGTLKTKKYAPAILAPELLRLLLPNRFHSSLERH